MNQLLKSCVWSNILALIPIGILFKKKYYFISTILFISVVYSFLYHYHDENKMGTEDQLFGLLSLFTLLRLYYYNTKIKVWIIWSIIFMSLAFWCFYRAKSNRTKNKDEYYFYHCLWHLFGIIGFTIIAIYI